MNAILRLLRYLVIVLLALSMLAAAAGWLVSTALFDEQPALTRFEKASLEDLQRIKSLALDINRQNDPAGARRVTLSERDINLGISHFAPMQLRIPKSSYAKVTLQQRASTIHITVPAAFLSNQTYVRYKNHIPSLLLPLTHWAMQALEDQWLNLQWQLTLNSDGEHSEWLQPGPLTIGSIRLHQSLSESIAVYVYQQAMMQPGAKLALETWHNIQRLEIVDHQLNVDFVLPQNAPSALSSYQSLVLSSDEQALINIYLQQISTLPQSGPLVSIVAAMFQLASERSNSNADPIAENRAVLLALSKRYGGDQLLNMLEAQPARLLQEAPRPYKIYGRKDLAQHMVLSAGLTLIANKDLAELVGLDKEIADLVGGRTISAWDLLADRAGVRLAENATRNAESALQVQRILARASRDRHLLPDLGAEFDYSEDKFSVDELNELDLMIELYLEQHPALQK